MADINFWNESMRTFTFWISISSVGTPLSACKWIKQMDNQAQYSAKRIWIMLGPAVAALRMFSNSESVNCSTLLRLQQHHPQKSQVSTQLLFLLSKCPCFSLKNLLQVKASQTKFFHFFWWNHTETEVRQDAKIVASISAEHPLNIRMYKKSFWLGN